jgi:hypothetical protein
MRDAEASLALEPGLSPYVLGVRRGEFPQPLFYAGAICCDAGVGGHCCACRLASLIDEVERYGSVVEQPPIIAGDLSCEVAGEIPNVSPASMLSTVTLSSHR